MKPSVIEPLTLLRSRLDKTIKMTETGKTNMSNFLNAALSLSGSMQMTWVVPMVEAVSTGVVLSTV